MDAMAMAIIFPLSGAMVGRFITANIIISFYWLPMILFLTHQAIVDTTRKRWLIWLTLGQALFLQSGHLQIPAQLLPIQVLYGMLLAWSSGGLAQTARRLAIPILLVCTITLPYYWIVADTVAQTDRGVPQSEQNLLDFSFNKQALLGTVWPHAYGKHETQESHPVLGGPNNYTGPRNEIETAGYVGPGLLLFAAIALILSAPRKDPLWITAIVAALLGLALAPGASSPVYSWLVSSGAQTWFNIPARFFFYLYTAALILCAFGLQLVKHPKLRTITLLLIIAPPVVVGWFWHSNEPWKDLRTPAAAEWMLRNTNPGEHRLFARTGLFETQPNNNYGISLWRAARKGESVRQTFSSPFSALSGVAIKLANEHNSDDLVTVEILDESDTAIRKVSKSLTHVKDGEWTVFEFAPITAKDARFALQVTSSAKKPSTPFYYIHTNPEQDYYPKGALSFCRGSSKCTPVVADTRSTDLAFTMLSPENAESLSFQTLAPSSAAGTGIESAQWLGPLALRQTKLYLQRMTTGDEKADWLNKRNMIDRFSISHAGSLIPATGSIQAPPNFTPVYQKPESSQHMLILENSHAFPRVSSATSVLAAATAKEQIADVNTLPSDVTGTVAADISSNATFIPITTIETLHRADGRVQIATNSNHKGFLVVRDVNAKYWQAKVNAGPTPLRLVDGLFMGVETPPGSHIITFEYNPPYTTPLSLMLTGWIMLGTWSVYIFRRSSEAQ